MSTEVAWARVGSAKGGFLTNGGVHLVHKFIFVKAISAAMQDSITVSPLVPCDIPKFLD